MAVTNLLVIRARLLQTVVAAVVVWRTGAKARQRAVQVTSGERAILHLPIDVLRCNIRPCARRPEGRSWRLDDAGDVGAAVGERGERSGWHGARGRDRKTIRETGRRRATRDVRAELRQVRCRPCRERARELGRERAERADRRRDRPVLLRPCWEAFRRTTQKLRPFRRLASIVLRCAPQVRAARGCAGKRRQIERR